MLKDHKCLGCGITLQHDNPQEPGYQEQKGQTYCQSCFKLLNYGHVETHIHPNHLPTLDQNSLVFMVSSVLHLDLLFSYPVHRYQKHATFVYIINQIDILPKQTNLELLLKQIILKAKNEKIPFKDIILMSAKNKHDLNQLKTYILNQVQSKIYLIGVQNSGKTTLFKALTNNQEALAFKKAGLTIEPLVGQLEDKNIYDMPGLYQDGYLHHFLPYQTYKKLIPDQEIKPKIFQIKDKQTIFIEGLFSITYHGQPSSMVYYLSRFIRFHKTNQDKVLSLWQKKEDHFDIHLNAYEKKAYQIPEGKHQVTFADMGMMHINGPAHIEITYPKHMHLSLTKALFL